MTYATEWERAVEEYGGIKKGDRVQLRPEMLLRYRMGGLTPESVAKHATPGTVAQIIVSERYLWNSAQIVRDDGFESWQACGDLEVVKGGSDADR